MRTIAILLLAVGGWACTSTPVPAQSGSESDGGAANDVSNDVGDEVSTEAGSSAPIDAQSADDATASDAGENDADLRDDDRGAQLIGDAGLSAAEVDASTSTDAGVDAPSAGRCVQIDPAGTVATSFPASVDMSSDYLYVTATGPSPATRVFAITDPLHAVMTASLPLAPASDTPIVGRRAVSDNALFVMGEPAQSILQVFDLSDPAKPALKGTIANTLVAGMAAGSQRLALLRHSPLPIGTNYDSYLTVYDVSDLANAIQLAELQYTGRWPISVVLRDDYVYVTSSTALNKPNRPVSGRATRRAPRACRARRGGVS